MSGQRNANRRQVSYEMVKTVDERPGLESTLQSHRNTISKLPAGTYVPMLGEFIASPKLIEFCAAVEKEAPGIKFIPYSSDWTYINISVADGEGMPTADLSVRAVSHAHGYFDGDPYVSVRVGIDTTDDKYVISSRTIRNNRYKNNTREFYHAYANTLPSAIKAFRKSFRRVTPQEVASIEHHLVAAGSTSYRRELEMARHEAGTQVWNHPAFVPFLRALVQGNTPPEAVIKPILQQAEKYVSAFDVTVEASNVANNLLYVQINPAETATYSVVPYDHSTTKISAQCYVTRSEEELEDKFPGALGRVAVLAMTDKNMFVHGVGMRTHDNCFWVVR